MLHSKGVRQVTARFLANNWKWLFGIAVSVLITFYSYPPHEWGWLMFVGLVPVFLAAESAKTWKQAAFRVWLYVFFGNALICFWVAHSVHEFTKLPMWLSYPSVAILSVAEQGSWPLLAALRHLLHKRFGIRPLFWTPLALMFLDLCWPKFFPNTMGNVFYSIPWLSQLADVTGVWGLTALLAMTNELIAVLILKSWTRPERIKHGMSTLVALVAAFSYAGWRYGKVRELMAHAKDHLRVALVQPNVNGPFKIRAEEDKDAARAELLSRMLKLTDRALELKPELVFWPETAYPDTYHGESYTETTEVTLRLDEYIQTRKANLLFGARDQRRDRRYNSLYLATPAIGRATPVNQVYHKTILLTLAEHVPFGEIVPGLADLMRSAGGAAFTPGSGPHMLDGPRDLKLGAMICLEGLYARYVREIAAGGADVLVNATNDSWFGPGLEPALHLYLTAFRAIETRRPLVRATNTGHSVVVDIDGHLRFKTALYQEDVRVDDVPLYGDVRSPFMIVGDWLLIAAGLYAAAPFLALAWRRRKT